MITLVPLLVKEYVNVTVLSVVSFMLTLLYVKASIATSNVGIAGSSGTTKGGIGIGIKGVGVKITHPNSSCICFKDNDV
jgi:hypothetical protein